ncbi:MAG: hypothetical protein GXP01_06940, partial [Alphaproteobacteria bacterium]|nr:hypothetical protein [Alphaproteobacteria bacterium]
MQKTTLAPIDRLNALMASSPDARAAAAREATPAMPQAKSGGQSGRDALLAAFGPVTLATAPIISETAILVAHVEAFWVWFQRDVAPPIALDVDARASHHDRTAQDALRPDAAKIAAAAETALADARQAGQIGRLAVQVGGDEIVDRIPFIVTCLRNLELITKAGAFGRAINTLDNQAAIEQAIKALGFPDGDRRRIWTLAGFRAIAAPRQFFDALVAVA